jgi:hypothetical protein
MGVMRCNTAARRTILEAADRADNDPAQLWPVVRAIPLNAGLKIAVPLLNAADAATKEQHSNLLAVLSSGVSSGGRTVISTTTGDWSGEYSTGIPLSFVHGIHDAAEADKAFCTELGGSAPLRLTTAPAVRVVAPPEGPVASISTPQQQLEALLEAIPSSASKEERSQLIHTSGLGACL